MYLLYLPLRQSRGEVVEAGGGIEELFVPELAVSVDEADIELTFADVVALAQVES